MDRNGENDTDGGGAGESWSESEKWWCGGSLDFARDAFDRLSILACGLDAAQTPQFRLRSGQAVGIRGAALDAATRKVPRLR